MPMKSAHEGQESGTMRVLVVEDNRDAANSMAALLRLWGFDPEVAGEGPPALETAAKNPPDAILIDIGLPGMNGFELAEQLSAKPELKSCVLAAVTAYSDPETIAHSKAAGMVQHFTKPADLVRL